MTGEEPNALIYPTLASALADDGWNVHLSMSEAQFDALYSALNAATGLILINGPVSSGKHLHVATILAYLADQERSCAAIEMKSRGAIPGVHSFTVDHLSAQRTLLASGELDEYQVVYFRELVGVEDLEALLAAVRCGKLVLTTTHAPDSFQAWKRLFMLAAQSQQRDTATDLAQALLLIQSQRRLDRLCSCACNARRKLPVTTLSLDAVEPGYRWPRTCSNCKEQPLTGFYGDHYIYESRIPSKGKNAGTDPSELVGETNLLDCAMQHAGGGLVSPGDASRCAAPGREPLHDFSDAFLAFAMEEPPENLSASVFSLAIQDYLNYPRLCVEYCADKQRLEQRELLISEQGYFINNHSAAGSETDSLDFCSERGRLPVALVEQWFEHFLELQQLLMIQPALEHWQRILDAPFQEADYYGYFSTYHHCQTSSLEEARKDFDCHTLEHVHAGLAPEPRYPVLTLRYETGPTTFIDGWNGQAREALSKLAARVLAQFGAAKPLRGARSNAPGLPLEIHRPWSFERYLRRVYELPIVRQVRRIDAPGGYYR